MHPPLLLPRLTSGFFAREPAGRLEIAVMHRGDTMRSPEELHNYVKAHRMTLMLKEFPRGDE